MGERAAVAFTSGILSGSTLLDSKNYLFFVRFFFKFVPAAIQSEHFEIFPCSGAPVRLAAAAVHFFPVVKRCCKSSKKATLSGDPTLRPLSLILYESPLLRGPTSPVIPSRVHAARLRRPESAWSAASSASRLGCSPGYWSGAGAVPLAGGSTTHRAWST